MSKTFKSADDGSRQLTVDRLAGDPRLLIRDGCNGQLGFRITPSDAPAVALAILKAMGVEPMFNSDAKFGTDEQLGHIQDHLHEYVKAQEATAAAEADRVKLEQEALVLFKASGAYGSDRPLLKFNDLEDHVQQCWLAVARAARELNKEAGQ